MLNMEVLCNLCTLNSAKFVCTCSADALRLCQECLTSHISSTDHPRSAIYPLRNTDRLRIKLKYNHQLYNLGGIPSTFQELLSSVSRIVQDLPNTSNLDISYTDNEGDIIHLTNTDALLEAFRHTNGTLLLQIQPARRSQPKKVALKDDILLLQIAYEKCSAVFKVLVDNHCKGVGIMIDDKVALTSPQVLPNEHIASQAVAVFDSGTEPLYFQPAELWIACNEFVLVSFKKSHGLVEIQLIHLEHDYQLVDNVQILTLSEAVNEDILHELKYINIRDVIAGRLYYDTHTACGYAGSPVFDCDFKLIGMQMTSEECSNEAVRCGEILNYIKQQPITPAIISLLSKIEPNLMLNKTIDYNASLAMTDSPQACRVYGISSVPRDDVKIYNVKTYQTSSISLNERLGEGSSICAFPHGLFITGGKASLRKFWLHFFLGDEKWYTGEMIQAHYGHCSIFHDDKIYVIAGSNSKQPIRNVESFDYKQCKWTVVHVLRQARAFPSVSVFNDKMFVCGGMCNNEYLSSIETYQDDQWTFYELRMPTHMYGCCVFPLDNSKLVLLGGMYDKTRVNSKVYIMNTVLGKFEAYDLSIKVGLSNSFGALEQDYAVYFYSNEGTLMKFDKVGYRVDKLISSVICEFE